MKQVILLGAFLLAFLGTGLSQTGPKRTPGDGLYLLTRMDTVLVQHDSLKMNEVRLGFNEMFAEYEDQFTTMVIDTTQYVPLDLEKSPVAEQQTEQKKKLMLSLTPEASEKLKAFTAEHVLKRVALVVDGEVLTVHKIKEPITSGQLQITRCTDNACELLYVKLKDNVRK